MDMSSRHLVRGQVVSFPCPAPGCRVHCLSGVLWITQDRTAGDRIIGRDEAYTAQGKGRIVIEAMADAIMNISLHQKVTGHEHEGRSYHAGT